MFSIFSSFNSVLRLKFIPIVSATVISVIAIIVSPQYLEAQNITDGGSITIRSDSQEANSETGVITAQGNVRINYPSRQIQATATQAQYYSRERRLVLNGNVYVIQEGNSIRAESMTYLIDEGRFIATPRADRQVESTYVVTEPINEQSTEDF
ncbi:MAG: LptA/OstA family protein [Xenococcus sp. MO_188.B8]|nr:LptA/OstA family protein [Xenococcus sp. MO_188.B8]